LDFCSAFIPHGKPPIWTRSKLCGMNRGTGKL
jgi:hypothetical protein